MNRRHFLTAIGAYTIIPPFRATVQDKATGEKPRELPGTPLRRVLPSGLRLIVVERPEAALVGVSLGVRVGSGDEERSRSGTLHFMEHLVFKGSAEKLPGAVDRVTESLGGEVGARTLRDATFFETAVAPESWESLLTALSELVLRPAFRPADIEAEKKVVQAEMVLERIDPLRAGITAAAKALYLPGEPYGVPLFGEWPLVSKLTSDDLQAVHIACYRPARMTLCVVGPVVAHDVEAAATRLFTGPQVAPVVRPLRQVLLVPPPRDGQGYRAPEDTEAASRGLTTLVCVWSVPPVADVVSGAALAVLAELLTQGDGGRLGASLIRKQGIALRVRAELISQRCGGLFTLAVTGLPRDARRLEAALLDELRRILEDGFSADEVEVGRRAVRGRAVTEGASVEGLARRLALYDALDTPGLEVELERQLPLVRGEALQALLRTTLHPRFRSVAVLGPQPLAVPTDGGQF